MARGEGSGFAPPLGHAHDEEAPPVGVGPFVEQTRQLAFQAAHIGELAQPLRLARELTVAGFIRGSLDEGVGDHAFFACFMEDGGAQQAPCPRSQAVRKQGLRGAAAPRVPLVASPRMDSAPRDLEQGLDS